MNVVSQTLVGMFSLRKKRTFREWIEAEVIIPEGAHASLPFRVDTRPWVAAVIPFFDEYNQFWISAVQRTGKSLLAAAFGLYQLDENGVGLQLLAPSENFNNDFYKDKWEEIIFANPRLQALLPDRYSRNVKKPDVRINLTNGGVVRRKFQPNQIKSYDASVLIATEAAEFKTTDDQGDMISLAQSRQDDHRGGIQLFESTHTRDTVRFAKEIKNGTDSRLHCPCPHCGEYFEPGVRGEIDKETRQVKEWYIQGWDVKDKDDIDTYIYCPNCKGEVREGHRPEMLRHIKVVHTRPDAKAFSITINWFHTKWTFEDVGKWEWELKQEWDVDSFRDLMQRIYCLPVSEEDEISPEGEIREVTTQVLLARARTKFRKGEIPVGLDRLYASIDVQKKWLYWQLYGENEQGFYIPDFGVVEIVPKAMQKYTDATQEMVIDALNECYEMLLRFNPDAIAIDVSYKHEASDRPLIKQWAHSNEVYQFAGRSRGQHEKLGKKRSVPAEVQDYIQCYRQKRFGSIYYLDVDKLKDFVLTAMRYSTDAMGRIFLPNNIGDLEHRWLLRHLTSEKPVLNQKTNRVEWQKKNGVTRNDQWDLVVYNRALSKLIDAKGLTMVSGNSGIDSFAAEALGIG